MEPISDGGSLNVSTISLGNVSSSPAKRPTASPHLQPARQGFHGTMQKKFSLRDLFPCLDTKVHTLDINASKD